jgi:Cytochrome c554 and c-prime
MKRLAVTAMAGSLLVLMTFTFAQAEYKYQFIGAAKCKVCHMSKKRGNQWGVWLESRHAKAFETLATDEAKTLAKGGKSPQEDPACLKCHVAGWDAPAEMLGTKYDKADGVSCESCHGPGKGYSPMKIMKDSEQAAANGLVAQKKEDCLKCHNKESPTYKPFDYDTFWAKIKHDIPEKTEAK